MVTPALFTEYAPPTRLETHVVRSQYRSFIGTHCREFFDSLPTMILALNTCRQIVFANASAAEFLGVKDVDEVLGRRPGEVLSCVNSGMSMAGCGTSRHCRHCGSVKAIMSAIEGVVESNECKLLRRCDNMLEALDLHVNAAPITVDGERFVIFSITDISHEVRRRHMERIFFHDILNLAGGIRGLAEVLKDAVPPHLSNEMGVLHSTMEALVDEILAQREIMAAENDELSTRPEPLFARELLDALAGLYANAPVAQGRTVLVDSACPKVTFTADPRLMRRVLGNMLKNALEAVPQGSAVTLSCKEDGPDVLFRVHNPGVIAEAVQLDIFRRTFSTKGPSRGLGTYSILLLTERYLGGTAGFLSTPEEGTVFWVRIPREAPAPAEDASSTSA